MDLLLDAYSPVNLLYIFKGLMTTIGIAISSIIIGFLIASIIAVIRYSKIPVLNFICFAYTEVFRATPLILLLFMSFFGLPALGIYTSLFIKALVAIVIFNSALLAEIIRGGLNSVDKGQIEAARSQGLSYTQTLNSIIAPQALRKMIPPIVSQFITVIKDTSFAAPLGLIEMLGAGTILWNQQLNWIFPLIILIAFLYFILNYTLSVFSLKLEKHLDS